MSEVQNQPVLFNLQLNIDQINVVLSQVGKLPYETIAPLMDTIRGQVGAQIEQLQQQSTVEEKIELDTPETVQ